MGIYERSNETTGSQLEMYVATHVAQYLWSLNEWSAKLMYCILIALCPCVSLPSCMSLARASVSTEGKCLTWYLTLESWGSTARHTTILQTLVRNSNQFNEKQVKCGIKHSRNYYIY
jgi:hypothetical protein